jgi:hypothetical protein
MVVLIVTISYTIVVTHIAIKVNNFFPELLNVKLVSLAVSFLSSLGCYEILVKIIYFFVGRIELLLKLYWGDIYLHGLWYYTYTINGERRYGYWSIMQDIYTISVIGAGVNPDGTIRSDVQSITSLIKNGNSYEIINKRRDNVIVNEDFDHYYFSKTTLIPCIPAKGSAFKYPTMIRGATIIYGGKLSGNEHRDVVFYKCDEGDTEIKVIEKIKDIAKNGNTEL